MLIKWIRSYIWGQELVRSESNAIRGQTDWMSDCFVKNMIIGSPVFVFDHFDHLDQLDHWNGFERTGGQVRRERPSVGPPCD